MLSCCLMQADGVTPCQRVGIMYSPWHWPAYTAQQIIASKGYTPLNVEMILNSRLELGASFDVSIVHANCCSPHNRCTHSSPQHVQVSVLSVLCCLTSYLTDQVAVRSERQCPVWGLHIEPGCQQQPWHQCERSSHEFLLAAHPSGAHRAPPVASAASACSQEKLAVRHHKLSLSLSDHCLRVDITASTTEDHPAP